MELYMNYCMLVIMYHSTSCKTDSYFLAKP